MGVVIKLIFIAAIAAFAIMAVSSAMKLIFYYKVRSNGVFGEGKIVGNEEKGDMLMSIGGAGNGDARKIYPVVEYKTESGTAVRAVYKGFVLKGRNDYAEGKDVQIKYNPSNPEEFIIIGDGELWGNALCMLIMGIFFAGMAAAMMFIFC